MDMSGSAGSNLRSVYLECARHAVEVANERAEKQGPLDAELVPDVTAAWYALVTEPGHEKLAVSHLIGRRFGIYLPEEEITEIRRGRKVTRRRLLLPGYVFVFVWGIERHTRRLRSIPGVIDIMHSNERPQVIPDYAIDRLREIENENNPISISITIEDVIQATAKPKKRKGKKGRRRHSRPPPRQWSVADARKEIIGTHAYSPFIEALRDESEDVRLAAFHKLLEQFPMKPLTESGNRVSAADRDAS
jgi:transcription antitermination factor NusG